MRSKKKESISILLSGKQLTFLTTGIFVISVLSFLFGVFLVKGLEPDLGIKEIVPGKLVSASIPVKIAKNPLPSNTKESIKTQNKNVKEKQLTFFDSLSDDRKKNNKIVKKQTDVNRKKIVKQNAENKKKQHNSKKYSIQVVSYRDESNAKSLLSTLQDKGYDAYVVKADIPKKGVFFRVRVGKYSKKASADTILTKLYTEEASNMKFGKPILVVLK